MGPGIDVLPVAPERRAGTAFSLLQPALLEINVAHRVMMMGLVQVINLRLQLLDTAAVPGARQLESASRRRRRAINGKVIEERGESEADEDEKRPEPLTTPERVNEHPQAEQG